MSWEQTTSASFRARHDATEADEAHRVLQTLERTRARLEDLLPRVPTDLTVVLHDRTAALALSNPAMLGRWALAAPSSRRYVAGWTGRDEIHVLSEAAHRRRRESGAPPSGTREMLRLAAAALYAERAIAESNPDLARVMGLVRTRRRLRWAWLVEGASRWLSGQSEHARTAVLRRLREDARPAFPPSVRDAPLLGATVFHLLADEQGERAAARLAMRLPSEGPRFALERAFDRRLVNVEGDWRAWLSRLAAAER